MTLTESPSIADTAVACLLPLLLFVLGYRLLERPQLSLRDILDIIKGPTRAPETNEPGYFSVQRAILSYDTSLSLAQDEVDAMRRSYGKLGRAHKRIGYDLGYTRKLNRLEEINKENAAVAQAVAKLARQEFSEELDRVPISSTKKGDLGRVREALKHFVRDWSDEGREERQTIFTPILAFLSNIPASRRDVMKVLVPGSGLGRLAWEISQLGYGTIAVELSSFMTLALRFLMSPSTTQRPRQHTIYPFASWFSHTRSNDDIFRPVSFPDIVPCQTENLRIVEGDFLSHRCAPSPDGKTRGYDVVVTLFFIDTSTNVIATLEHIYSILRPGGTWINLGPLLWTSGGQARLELSLEEVLDLAETIGFKIQDRRLGHEGQSRPRRSTTIECEYTADQTAMMRWIYKAEFWVATKGEW